jgi:hypothetical protein
MVRMFKYAAMEVHRSTDDGIRALFMCVDTVMTHIPTDPPAQLYPSEIVTFALRFARKGVARAVYRSLRTNDLAWFPGLPERTGLFRLCAPHADWVEVVLAQLTTLVVIDSGGITVCHP